MKIDHCFEHVKDNNPLCYTIKWFLLNMAWIDLPFNESLNDKLYFVKTSFYLIILPRENVGIMQHLYNI